MRNLIIILILFMTGTGASAQTEKSFFYGSSASIDLGRFQDRFEITPMAGFKILPKTYLGLGVTLSYYSTESAAYQTNENIYIETEIKNKIWYKGGEVFLRFSPFENKQLFVKNLYFQTSYEALWGKGKYNDESGKYDYNTDNFTPFAGIGYKQPFSDKFSLGLMLNFKLNDESDSLYRNPVVRVSFEF